MIQHIKPIHCFHKAVSPNMLNASCTSARNVSCFRKEYFVAYVSVVPKGCVICGWKTSLINVRSYFEKGMPSKG